MADLKQLTDSFLTLFGGEAENIRFYQAPGRVNLIGEHTDYNGGYVFPAALTFGTTLLLRPREDRLLRFASTNFPDKRFDVALDGIAHREEDDWSNYPKGIVHELQKADGDRRKASTCSTMARFRTARACPPPLRSRSSPATRC